MPGVSIRPEQARKAIAEVDEKTVIQTGFKTGLQTGGEASTGRQNRCSP